MAHPEEESLKKHGDGLGAMQDADRHSKDAGGTVSSRPTDPVPTPENGAHEKSHAAHLGHVHEQTKPADKLRQGMAANTLREPPMVVQRVGKQHR